jgi:hypothetical protein
MIACDSFPAAEGLGVTTESGELVIIFVACGNDTVRTVAVARQVGDSPWDEDDQVLWRISSTGHTSHFEFAVSDTPTGFREEQRLNELLPPDEELVALVETTRVGLATEFQSSELEAGIVRTARGNHLEKSRFLDQANNRCD